MLGSLLLASLGTAALHCGDRISALSQPRTYVVETHDAVVAGVATPGTGVVRCDFEGTVELTLSVAHPQRPRVVITDGASNEWELFIPRRQIGRAFTIRLAPGNYGLAASDAHYMREMRSISIAKATTRVAFNLHPRPVFSGRLIASQRGTPVANGLVETDRGERAQSDGDGRFEVEVASDVWPRTLMVTATGFASMSLTIPAARANKSFGDITLLRPAAIVADVRHPDGVSVKAVDLKRVRRGEFVAGPNVKTIAIDGDSSHLLFQDLEPGDYAIVARGSGPGERFGERLSVHEGETKFTTIDLTPFHLRLEARMSGQPLARASIRLWNEEGLWEDDFVADDDGKADLILWQAGRCVVHAFRAGTMNVSYRESRKLIAQNGDWLIEIPEQAVQGTVVDSVSGKPVANAVVSLSIERTDGSGIAVKTRTDAEGRFRLAPVPYGLHRLHVFAGRYMPTEERYSFLEPQQTREVAFRIDPADIVALTIVDRRNQPVAGAQMVIYGTSGFLAYSITDETGIARIPNSAYGLGSVWIVPRDGSFAFAQISDTAAEQRVQIADGTTRIVIRCESDGHQAISNVALAVRYNGRVLPYQVLAAIVNAQGGRLMSDSNGQIVFERMPAGLYEFWPIGSPAALRDFTARSEESAPVRLAAAGGDAVATLTFERIEK